jgi:hypothetical protein
MRRARLVVNRRKATGCQHAQSLATSRSGPQRIGTGLNRSDDRLDHLSTGNVSLGSLVGFVTVLGIAARNGIMLVSHYGMELVQRGSEERLVPIAMTALATGLALLPLVASGLKPGHEVEYPLAIVILGGLVTSTLLNLFMLPPLYLRYGIEPSKNAKRDGRRRFIVIP